MISLRTKGPFTNYENAIWDHSQILQPKLTKYFLGLFVVVSWISFVVPPDVIPGRMALLITLFLVLVNIFNTVTTNTPKAEGLTAIETWMLSCLLFVFGALVGRVSETFLLIIFIDNQNLYRVCLYLVQQTERSKKGATETSNKKSEGLKNYVLL